MALDPGANFSKSTLSTGYASGATTLVLTTGGGAKFPAPSFNAVYYDSGVYADPSDDPNVEIVRVTGVSTDTLTVTRAQEGTSAANHNTAGHTYTLVAGPTSKLLTDILGISITGSAATVTGAAQTAITSVGTLSGLTVTAAPTFSALTLGSVPFASTAGLLAQDNANLFWDATNKRLGIGTTAPGSPLDVKGAGAGKLLNVEASSVGTDYVQMTLNNTGGEFSIANDNSTGGIYALSNYATVLGTVTNTDFGIITNSLKRIVVLAGGNVGIGTAAPGNPLHIANATGAKVVRVSGSGTNGAYISLDNTAAVAGFGIESSGGGSLFSGGLAYATFLQAVSNHALKLGTNNTANLTILSGGNVGIGTTAPGLPLSVKHAASGGITTGTADVLFLANGDASGSPKGTALYMGAGDNLPDSANARIVVFTDAANAYSSKLQIQTHNNVGAGQANYNTGLYMDAAGNVGIGTTAPTMPLSVRAITILGSHYTPTGPAASFTSLNTNGGATPAAAEGVITLTRTGVSSQASSNIAELR